jgi:hypothetical protein
VEINLSVERRRVAPSPVGDPVCSSHDSTEVVSVLDLSRLSNVDAEMTSATAVVELAGTSKARSSAVDQVLAAADAPVVTPLAAWDRVCEWPEVSRLLTP